MNNILFNLPIEVLTYIASFLPKPDLYQLTTSNSSFYKSKEFEQILWKPVNEPFDERRNYRIEYIEHIKQFNTIFLPILIKAQIVTPKNLVETNIISRSEKNSAKGKTHHSNSQKRTSKTKKSIVRGSALVVREALLTIAKDNQEKFSHAYVKFCNTAVVKKMIVTQKECEGIEINRDAVQENLHPDCNFSSAPSPDINEFLAAQLANPNQLNIPPNKLYILIAKINGLGKGIFHLIFMAFINQAKIQQRPVERSVISKAIECASSQTLRLLLKSEREPLDIDALDGIIDSSRSGYVDRDLSRNHLEATLQIAMEDHPAETRKILAKHQNLSQLPFVRARGNLCPLPAELKSEDKPFWMQKVSETSRMKRAEKLIQKLLALPELPNELWMHIISFLSKRDLYLFTLSSSRFYCLGHDQSLWQPQDQMVDPTRDYRLEGIKEFQRLSHIFLRILKKADIINLKKGPSSATIFQGKKAKITSLENGQVKIIRLTSLKDRYRPDIIQGLPFRVVQLFRAQAQAKYEAFAEAFVRFCFKCSFQDMQLIREACDFIQIDEELIKKAIKKIAGPEHSDFRKFLVAQFTNPNQLEVPPKVKYFKIADKMSFETGIYHLIAVAFINLANKENRALDKELINHLLFYCPSDTLRLLLKSKREPITPSNIKTRLEVFLNGYINNHEKAKEKLELIIQIAMEDNAMETKKYLITYSDSLFFKMKSNTLSFDVDKLSPNVIIESCSHSKKSGHETLQNQIEQKNQEEVLELIDKYLQESDEESSQVGSTYDFLPEDY